MSSKSSLRCAAQAATGHLTRVKYINLQDMELSSRPADLLSLTRAASGVVELSNVTGDFPLLLASLTCEELDLRNMEVDQVAINTELPGCCGQQGQHWRRRSLRPAPNCSIDNEAFRILSLNDDGYARRSCSLRRPSSRDSRLQGSGTPDQLWRSQGS